MSRRAAARGPDRAETKRGPSPWHVLCFAMTWRHTSNEPCDLGETSQENVENCGNMITVFARKIAVLCDGVERGHIEVDHNHICLSVNGESPCILEL